MPEDKPEGIDPFDIHVNYLVNSSLGLRENDKFKPDIIGEIIEVNDYGDKVTDVGKICAYKLLIDVGLSNGWDTFSICDVEQESMDIDQIVYNFQTNDWSEGIEKHYEIIIPINLLVVTSIEIKSEYNYLDIPKQDLSGALVLPGLLSTPGILYFLLWYRPVFLFPFINISFQSRIHDVG